MIIIWIFLGIIGAAILMIIFGGILGESQEEKFRKQVAENRRKEAEEERRKEVERAEIAERLSKSDLFKQLKAKIFVPGKEMPQEIHWRSMSRIWVEYETFSFDNFSISEDEVPNCLEFMRALGHLYRDEYSYNEYDMRYDGDGYSITLYRKTPSERPTW